MEKNINIRELFIDGKLKAHPFIIYYIINCIIVNNFKLLLMFSNDDTF